MAQADELTALTGEGGDFPPPALRSRNRVATPSRSGGSPRRRGTRGGRRHRKLTGPAATAEAPLAVVEAEPVVEEKPKPKRARGTRGGVGRKRKPRAEAAEPAVVHVETKPAAAKTPAKPKAAPRSRSGAKPARTRKPETPFSYDDKKPLAKNGAAPARARVPVTGEPVDVPAPFAHNAEYEFARILDFYGITWQYEPRSFPLRWERGHVTEAFTPDFYLQDLDLYVELTTLKPGLTAEKNRKMRQLKELYPETNIMMLKKRDYLRLLAKYGYGAIAPDQVPDIDKVLIPATRLSQRVQELGAQISKDYEGKEPILVGVLRGVLCFIADLMRQISVPTSVDLMAVSSYEGTAQGAARILKDLDLSIKGRDVILVEDIVDTGMTLNTLIDYLQTKKPASIKVAALLDKRVRRLVNVPVDYVGFEIPDEFVVGYGLDFNQRFRNLPFIATLKHELLP
jgi:hypoxanthine phosphoribosyltransferase